MRLAAGEIPDQPRIDVAEKQLAALGALARTLDVVEYPLDLGAGKICVYKKPGLVANIVADAVGGKLIADGRCASALPDDGVIHRLACVFIPNDRSLTLVCYAYAGYVRRGKLAFFKCLGKGAKLRFQYDHRVVFDPAGLGIYLWKRILRYSYRLTLCIKNYRS